MRFIWISAVKDLRRLRREPITLLTWIGIPTFVALILVLVFGRGDPRPNGKLLVADEDGGIGATVLTSAFTQGALGEMITVEKVKREDGRRRMDKGDASALLIIPKDFTIALLESKPAKLELIRNPSQSILPDMIEQTLSVLADGAFYLQTIAGDQLRSLPRSAPPADARVADIAVQFKHVAESLRKYLAPPLIQLETKVTQEKLDQPGGFAILMLPGMLYMGVFFIAGGLAVDVWKERTAGALRRVATTPVTLGAFLAGKLLAAAIVLAIVGAFGLIVAHFLIDLPISNFPLAVVWIAASGSGLYLFMMLVQSLASTERVANMLSNFVLLPFTMLGGSFFPMEVMPGGFARIGRLTPNGWSLVQLKEILAGAWHPSAFAGVLVFIAAAWMVTVWRIRRSAW